MQCVPRKAQSAFKHASQSLTGKPAGMPVNALRAARPIGSWAFLLLACILSLTGCQSRFPTAAQDSTFIPTETKLPLPDLVVASVSLLTDPPTNCSDPAEGAALLVTVRNQGDGDANRFIVEANRARNTIQDGLPAGGELSIQFDDYQPDSRVAIDSNYRVTESDETNNELTVYLPLPTLPASCFVTPTPELTYQEPIRTLEGHTDRVLSVAFSPDSSLLASGSVDNSIRLWLVNEDRLLRTMSGQPFPVMGLDFAPNGATLATASSDGILRIWQVSNGLLLNSLSGHGDWITDVDYAPDGRTIATSSRDFTVRIWNILLSRLMKIVDEGMAEVNSLAYSPDGRLLAWAEQDGRVRILNLSSQTWQHILAAGSEPATSVAFSPDGALLASGYWDGALRIWDVSSGNLLQTINAHPAAVTDVEFALQGGWLATSSRDSTLRLWKILPPPSANLLQETPERVYTGHTGPVNSLAFSPSGGLLASAGDDAALRLWRLPPE
jgi:WD40 repeat protein